MNEDQRRLLNHEFRRLMTTAGKEKTPFNEIADQLTDLAVRFAKSELEGVRDFIFPPVRDASTKAPKPIDVLNLIEDRLATLGEPEKKCTCACHGVESDDRRMGCSLCAENHTEEQRAYHKGYYEGLAAKRKNPGPGGGPQ